MIKISSKKGIDETTFTISNDFKMVKDTSLNVPIKRKCVCFDSTGECEEIVYYNPNLICLINVRG